MDKPIRQKPQRLPQTEFLRTSANRPLILLTLIASLVYFLVLVLWFPKGNTVLFVLLLAGEVFHLWQAFTYAHTIWKTEYEPEKPGSPLLPVDVFITVAGEPSEIVEKTARAALSMRYPNFDVYLLNDGKVAKKDNWKEIELLAKRLGIACITREIPGGAKAGNINNALRLTNRPLVAIFDADQVPHPDFLQKTAGYFAQPKMALVQSPQYYQNFALNGVTRGAWEQQELFFGPICKGKNRLNATFMCGTNMIIRRTALIEAGGMNEENIAEDFLTSLFIHKNGWKSLYVPKVLAEGLAPEDFLSYSKQQFRWARGSLEIIFKHNPLFMKGLTFSQKIQYLASASFYLSGIVVLVNALLPLVYFFTGLMPLTISTMGLAVAFLPYIFLTVVTLQLSSNYSYTFRALSFSMSNFPIHLKAVMAVLLRQKSGFAVTSKTRLSGNFVRMVIPHLAYIALTIAGIAVAMSREGLNASLLSNLAWALFNISVFLPFIAAALPKTQPLAVPALQTSSPAAFLSDKIPPAPSPKAANRSKLLIPDNRNN